MALSRRQPLKRTGSLKRSGPLKRTGKKRINVPKHLRPSRQAVVGAQIRNREAFHEAARDQRVCAVCGRDDQWEAHHVVEKQWLDKNHKPLFVATNALRVCGRFSKNKCHEKHTNRSHKIRLKQLTDENIEYAFALMGPAAFDYLHRCYDGRDPRVDEHPLATVG